MKKFSTKESLNIISLLSDVFDKGGFTLNAQEKNEIKTIIYQHINNLSIKERKENNE